MIYPAYETAYNAIPYPKADAIREEEWAKFQAQPAPMSNKKGMTQADLKAIIKEKEAAHHIKVKLILSQKRGAYDLATEQVNENFRKGLAKEYLKDQKNCKEPLLWSMAWQKGHANGYAEVESHYQELSELVNDKFRNHYKHCGETWTDEWDATCDDECPVCGKDIQPYKSEDI